MREFSLAVTRLRKRGMLPCFDLLLTTFNVRHFLINRKYIIVSARWSVKLLKCFAHNIHRAACIFKVTIPVKIKNHYRNRNVKQTKKSLFFVFLRSVGWVRKKNAIQNLETLTKELKILINCNKQTDFYSGQIAFVSCKTKRLDESTVWSYLVRNMINDYCSE